MVQTSSRGDVALEGSRVGNQSYHLSTELPEMDFKPHSQPGESQLPRKARDGPQHPPSSSTTSQPCLHSTGQLFFPSTGAPELCLNVSKPPASMATGKLPKLQLLPLPLQSTHAPRIFPKRVSERITCLALIYLGGS